MAFDARPDVPEYPAIPISVLGNAALALLTGQKRIFRKDACCWAAHLSLLVDGNENIPTAGPALVAMNHYSRPGFAAWWMTMAVSASVSVEIHWVMTSAWTDAGTFWARLKAAVSRRLFPELAQMYGFTAMPPMPPRPNEVEQRARAVRQALAAARAGAVIGLAPEGMDTPDGMLMHPHPGVGRFIVHLARAGCSLYPVGVYEAAGALRLKFGAPFALRLPPGLTSDDLDRRAADQVMMNIAALLPERYRGIYL